jgi:hypothetical protein
MQSRHQKTILAGLAAAILAGPSATLTASGQGTNAAPSASQSVYYWPDPPPAKIAPSAPYGENEELDILNTGWSKETKLKYLNIGILGGMMLYGLIFWDYGENGFEFTNEGWFQYDTKYGGADKLGHALSTYFAVQAYSSVYERWGYDRHRANIYGALSGWGTFFMIEVADATSRYGFSYEDLIVDTIGAIVGYWRREYPEFEKRVDFRVEYWPSYAVTSGDDTDIASDYSGYKYLMALKGSGFDLTSSTWLQYLELQGGYYTRGYQNGDGDHYGDPHRVLYGALAVNLTHIFDKHNWNKTASFLRYYQVPYTYVPLEYNLDE